MSVRGYSSDLRHSIAQSVHTAHAAPTHSTGADEQVALDATWTLSEGQISWYLALTYATLLGETWQ